jgi:hypothetical protein
MPNKRSGKIDQSVPSAVVDEEKFKELFVDRLGHGDTIDYFKKIVNECIEQTGIAAKVNKCYTQEDYKKFEDTVETIVIKTLGSKDGQKEIDETATKSAKTFIQQNNWEKSKFWIPTLLSLGALIATVYIAFFKQ